MIERMGTTSGTTIETGYEIQERVLLDWRGPSGLVYGWNHYQWIPLVNDDGQRITGSDLVPYIEHLAEVFETDFRAVRVTTTTVVVCEEVGTTFEED